MYAGSLSALLHGDKHHNGGLVAAVTVPFHGNSVAVGCSHCCRKLNVGYCALSVLKASLWSVLFKYAVDINLTFEFLTC